MESVKPRKLIKLHDVYQQTFLTFRKIYPIGLEVVRGKTLFVYEAKPEVYEALNQYMEGAEVPCLEFVERLKENRSKMYQAREGVAR